MAQTQQPDDDAGVRAVGRTGGTPRIPEPGGEAPTSALPPVATGGPHTPGRGTAVPLSTVGDGRYRLTYRLGRGGMAEVFAAEDVRLGRTVAVKLLRGELAQDDVARLRFTREAHAVAALNHHSIVAVYDTGEEYDGDESTPYIVMELVEGRTVRELLADEEAPPVDQALIIIAGVLEALAYSHRSGIVHRDIKPANVSITNAGAVKVMDFGIARALTGGATTMTQTGMVMGTPQYLSPEQALGKPVDHRSDLYAAGCMLYELLTVRPPFTGDTPLSVVYQHVQDPPVPPSQANGRVPAGLDALVLRSLAKNPDDRFQDADEFRAHVQHALREMHGAGGAAWAGGAAVDTGATQVLRPDQAAATAAFGAVGPADQTSVLPYSTGGPHTPSSPYPAAGGPYGGGTGAGGDDDGPGRRRGPWAWVAGAIAVLVAAGAGIAFALSGSEPAGHSDISPQPPAATSTETTAPPSQSGLATPPASASGSKKPQQPTDPGNNNGNNNGNSGNNMSPSPNTGKHTPTPTPTGTASHTPTGTAPATTAPATTAPPQTAGPGTGSPKPPTDPKPSIPVVPPTP